MAETTPSYPAVGATAPAFTLPSSTGQPVGLSDFAGRPVVVFFYPKADTPGCTKEACGFRDALAGYTQVGVPVVGVSPDPVKAVTKFAEKFDLNFPLLADEDHAVCERYGVWQEKSMYGRKYMGAARVTFVIGKDGKVAHVFEKVKPEGHDKEVMDWLKENKLA
jgi:peroxiredoxin Q/BCP